MANRPGRTLRVLAATGTVGALMLISASSAAAVDPGANSSAFGLSATNVLGLVDIAPTPQSICPQGSTESALPVSLGALGNVGVLNASTTCDSAAGTSTATGGAADVALLGVAGARTITADVISAQCSATAPADPTGSTTVANLFIAGVRINVPVGSTTPQTINIPGVATVIINEQTLSNGVLTVNALHITLLGGALGDIIIGQASCGPNTAAPAIAAFSFQTLPLILGGLAILALLFYGLRTSLRRLRTTA